MGEFMNLEWIIGTLLGLVWVLLLLAMAGISLMRFRTTISGLLLGAGFGAWGLKVLLFMVAGPILVRFVSDPAMYYMMQSIASTALHLLLLLVLAGGIGMIPASLNKLSR